MFSFDLSTMNVLLVGIVVALLVVFVLVLMKLNPSTETKEHREHEIHPDKEKPIQKPSPPLQTPIPPKPLGVKTSNGKPATPINPPVKSAPVISPTRQEPPTHVHYENRESSKQEKTAQSAKMELTPTRKDCIHFYGYLHSLPKNTPIPDECFGCPKIVDCLVIANSNSRKRGG